MKLRTKIAGTVALPLALAIASAANAATVVDTDQHKLTIGGYVSAISTWNDTTGNAMQHNIGLGNSRLNVGYTNKEQGVTFFYEQNMGMALRHAYLSTTDGLVAGWTWSFGANLTALGETIDTDGPARAVFGTPGGSQARNGVLGQKFSLGDGMSVGVAIEDKAVGADAADTVVPDLVVNFSGDFGGTKVFAAATQYNQLVGAKDESATRITAGAAIPMGALGLKAGVTSDDGNLHVTGGLQFNVNDQVRANVVVEQNMYDAPSDPTSTSIWVNAFYKAANGVEWGGEIQSVSADAGTPAFSNASSGGTLNDGGMAVRLQAKYAF